MGRTCFYRVKHRPSFSKYTEEYAGHRIKAAEHGKDSHMAFTSVSSYLLPISVHSHMFVQDDTLKTATSELRTLLEHANTW